MLRNDGKLTSIGWRWISSFPLLGDGNTFYFRSQLGNILIKTMISSLVLFLFFPYIILLFPPSQCHPYPTDTHIYYHPPHTCSQRTCCSAWWSLSHVIIIPPPPPFPPIVVMVQSKSLQTSGIDTMETCDLGIPYQGLGLGIRFRVRVTLP